MKQQQKSTLSSNRASLISPSIAKLTMEPHDEYRTLIIEWDIEICSNHANVHCQIDTKGEYHHIEYNSKEATSEIQLIPQEETVSIYFYELDINFKKVAKTKKQTITSTQLISAAENHSILPLTWSHYCDGIWELSLEPIELRINKSLRSLPRQYVYSVLRPTLAPECVAQIAEFLHRKFTNGEEIMEPLEKQWEKWFEHNSINLEDTGCHKQARKRIALAKDVVNTFHTTVTNFHEA